MKNLIEFTLLDYICPKCFKKLTYSNKDSSLVCKKSLFEIIPKEIKGMPNNLLYEANYINKVTKSEEKVKFAYRIYSLFYDPVALFAMYFVWKGRMRPLLRWYKKSYENTNGKLLLDIAVGNGALTKLACRKLFKEVKVLFLDISSSMLIKAIKKMKKIKNAKYLIANAEEIPLPESSIERICCYGGIHVFRNRKLCFQSISRILKKGGSFWGSILLKPEAKWAVNVCKKYFIPSGLLGDIPTYEEISKELEGVNLKIINTYHNGHQLLFKAVKE